VTPRREPVADEGEAEDQLSQPGLGDREPEEQSRRIVRSGREGVVEGVEGLVALLVDELAADLVAGSEFGDRLALEGIEGELLPRRWADGACG
jgi:hypothetical protein